MFFSPLIGPRNGLGFTGRKPLASWTPAKLFTGGVEGAWYDPSDLTTMYQSGTRGSPGAPVAADGDPVGLILDKSGNGHDLTQAAAASRPLYKTAGGLRWLQFDGNDDMLTGTLPIASLGGNLSKTAIVAVRPSDGASRTVFHYGAIGTAGKAFGLSESPNGIEFFQWAADLIAAGQQSLLDKVITGIKNANLLTSRKNGAVIAGPTDEGATTLDSNALTVGSLPTFNLYLGRIYGVIIIAGNPDPTLAETWMGTKAGLAL
jgi:hypothetical protein